MGAVKWKRVGNEGEIENSIVGVGMEENAVREGK